jgi:hypothetical protein
MLDRLRLFLASTLSAAYGEAQNTEVRRLQIQPGTRVFVRTANRQFLPRRAVTGVVSGTDFPVVWVCREELWRPDLRPHDQEAVPWPSDAVKAADGHVDQ